MTWTDSRIFTQAMLNPLLKSAWTSALPTGYASLSADTINGALFNSTGTPNKDDTLANTCYGAGQWVVGNEVIDTGGSNWAAGGRALTSKAFAAGTGIVNFDAADLAGAGNVTITAAFGDLIYDVTISSPSHQAFCYNYFGGTQGVTAGTFTVVFDATGVLKFTN